MQPTANNPTKMYRDGFVAIPRNIVDDLQAGKMTAQMFPIYFTILQQVNWSTGVWNGNAHRIYHALSGTAELSDIKKQMAKLRRAGVIKSFHKQGRKGNYNVLINGFTVTQGELRGRVLNAAASTSWEKPVYESGTDTELIGNCDAPEKRLTSASSGTEKRLYQDVQDFQASKDVQDEQEVKSKTDPALFSPTQSEANGQAVALAADLSEMADEEGYNILFEGARKNSLAVLLGQYTPEQVKVAWAEYLDRHVDGTEYTVSHAARIFTETAEQLIYVINRRAKKEQAREGLIRVATENAHRTEIGAIPEAGGDVSELDNFPELDLEKVPELGQVELDMSLGD